VRQALLSHPSQPEFAEVDDEYRGLVAAHLSACHDCGQHQKDMQALREGLRKLPLRHAPAMLNTRLRVLASREHARHVARRDFRAWVSERVSRARLFFDNLLKPFAVPAAGGLLCSTLCFGMIVDTLHYSPDWQEDMPIGFSSEIGIEWSPFCFDGQDVVVQLTVDSTGSVTDYSIPQRPNPSSQELQEIGNLVLYSTFTPAMRMGVPVSSKRLFYIKHINVKG
jgi:hypothetical protein